LQHSSKGYEPQVFGILAAEVARAAGKIRPRLRLRPSEPVVKVNVGAGLCAAPGWLHVEGSIHAFMSRAPTPVLSALHRLSNSVRQELSRAEYIRILRSHDYVFYNLDRGLPLASDVVDYVYSSHVLEHFYPRDAEQLVRDMYRVLKPGGIIRICVPDLEHAVRLYQNGAKDAALRFFFVSEPRGSFARHFYMYDYAMLADLLGKAGFNSIIRRQYREGMTPDLDKLDNRPEETLYVEAQKPSGVNAERNSEPLTR
jgi:SAM-dependent methyltransferase